MTQWVQPGTATQGWIPRSGTGSDSQRYWPVLLTVSMERPA